MMMQSSDGAVRWFEARGIETIRCDLLDEFSQGPHDHARGDGPRRLPTPRSSPRFCRR